MQIYYERNPRASTGRAWSTASPARAANKMQREEESSSTRLRLMVLFIGGGILALVGGVEWRPHRYRRGLSLLYPSAIATLEKGKKGESAYPTTMTCQTLHCMATRLHLGKLGWIVIIHPSYFSDQEFSELQRFRALHSYLHPQKSKVSTTSPDRERANRLCKMEALIDPCEQYNASYKLPNLEELAKTKRISY